MAQLILAAICQVAIDLSAYSMSAHNNQTTLIWINAPLSGL
jgi:hypothetical protein